MYVVFFKRLIDVVVSFSVILLLLPLYAVLALVVYFDLGAPVIFKQKRPGKDNKIFTIYKFRTMLPECDKDGKKLSHSERITKTGRFLRRTYLDEIPEFFCVLCGTMTLIGPRPQLIEDMVFYSDEIMVRQSVTPGLTGLAQSKGKDGLGWDNKFKYDIQYTQNITFINDVKIIGNTLKMIFSKSAMPFDSSVDEGNYGDMLLREGRISKEDYDKALKYAKAFY